MSGFEFRLVPQQAVVGRLNWAIVVMASGPVQSSSPGAREDEDTGLDFTLS